MLTVMPDRNIPVKHTYSPREFGAAEDLGSFRSMNNVAAIRKSKGLSQVELADIVGVEQSTISKLERGNESVTLRTIQSVADALGVKVSDLFIDRSDAERTIIAAYRSLPEQRRLGWQDMAKAVISEDEEAGPPPLPRSDKAAG